MISTTLSLWGKGAVTLPKQWRERFPTKHFLAEEDAQGNLVITPVRKKPDDDIEYYEKKDGTIGLHFPNGIEAGVLAAMIKKANAALDKEESTKRRRVVRKTAARTHG